MALARLHPFCMLSALVDPMISPWELAPLIGIGLEAWADPILAARFTHRYFCFHLRVHSTALMAKTWSDRWEDRAKANAFIAEIARIWNASLGEPEEDQRAY